MIDGKPTGKPEVNAGKHAGYREGMVNGKPPLRGLPLPLPSHGKSCLRLLMVKGEMLKAQKEAGGMNEGGRPTVNHSHGDSGLPPKLSDMGITHSMSSRAQEFSHILGERDLQAGTR